MTNSNSDDIAVTQGKQRKHLRVNRERSAGRSITSRAGRT